jgi:drug/metabolite transporter (DMT)-like permease
MLRALRVRSRRGAYVALLVLTAIWGSNWIAMKLALVHADPVIFNLHRTWVAIAVVFGVLLWRRRSLPLPQSWMSQLRMVILLAWLMRMPAATPALSWAW